jgi:hypothetical protein
VSTLGLADPAHLDRYLAYFKADFTAALQGLGLKPLSNVAMALSVYQRMEPALVAALAQKFTELAPQVGLCI